MKHADFCDGLRLVDCKDGGIGWIITDAQSCALHCHLMREWHWPRLIWVTINAARMENNKIVNIFLGLIVLIRLDHPSASQLKEELRP